MLVKVTIGVLWRFANPMTGRCSPWTATEERDCRGLLAELAAEVARGAVLGRGGVPLVLDSGATIPGCALCLINLGMWHGPAATTLRTATGGYAAFGAALGHLILTYPTGRLVTGLQRWTVTLLYEVTTAYSRC